jgi:hypothetical protein
LVDNKIMEKGASRTSEEMVNSSNILHTPPSRPKHKVSSMYMLPPKTQSQPRIGPEYQASIPSVQTKPKSLKRKNEETSELEFKKPKIEESLI